MPVSSGLDLEFIKGYETNYELLTIRDGLIVRIREYYDESKALEAAGLRE